MPTQKDLKRLARARMRKTGESYTAARARLIEKKSRAATSPIDTSQAGTSDAAVKRATGRNWVVWVRALDAVDAASMPHREIASWVRERHGLSAWWSQTVTVGYERIRGLREVGQRRGGAYEANKSRTFPVSVSKLYAAFADTKLRARWIAGVTLTLRTSTPDKSIRITWDDGTSVHVQFNAKEAAKSQVQVQHAGLPSKAEAARLKAWWGERLDALAELLRQAGPRTRGR